MDAKKVYAFDIEDEAIKACKESLSNLEDCDCVVEQIDLTDIKQLEKYKQSFDTVLMNPPFGTKGNEGIDMKLLKNAIYVLNFYLKN